MGIRDIEEKLMTTATTTSFADSWKANFRHETFRKGQDTAIESMAKKLDEGEKFIIAELPTGIGKSDAAMALAKCAESAFITTSQNVLLEQYSKDFGSDPAFALVKGRANYECKMSYDNCNDGAKAGCYNYKKHSDIIQEKKNGGCVYKHARDKAVDAQVALTNTTYYATGCKNAMIWEPRKLTIIDEAHNLSGEVMSLTEMEITDRSLRKMQVAATIPFKNAGPVVVEQFAHFLEAIKEELDWTIEEWQRDDILSVTNGDLLEDMESLVRRIDWFMRSIENGTEWVVDFEIDKRGGERVIARALDTSYFAQELFFSKQARQFVLQSATIVDFKRYAEELGIDSAHTIRRTSPFDLSRRPIFDMATADMSYKNIDANLPLIAERIKTILRERPYQKGLIHTGSYKVQKYLEEQFSNSDRCFFPKPEERQKTIEHHFKSKDPTVMFSPSMTEGIDGKGDALRFQVLCKIPYPSLGDRRIKIKSERNPAWYQYQTLKAVIQSIGRGMRSEDDWCDNYVLDAGFAKFMSRSNAPSDITNFIRPASEGLVAHKVQR